MEDWRDGRVKRRLERVGAESGMLRVWELVMGEQRSYGKDVL